MRGAFCLLTCCAMGSQCPLVDKRLLLMTHNSQNDSEWDILWHIQLYSNQPHQSDANFKDRTRARTTAGTWSSFCFGIAATTSGTCFMEQLNISEHHIWHFSECEKNRRPWGIMEWRTLGHKCENTKNHNTVTVDIRYLNIIKNCTESYAYIWVLYISY